MVTVQTERRNSREKLTRVRCTAPRIYTSPIPGISRNLFSRLFLELIRHIYGAKRTEVGSVLPANLCTPQMSHEHPAATPPIPPSSIHNGRTSQPTLREVPRGGRNTPSRRHTRREEGLPPVPASLRPRGKENRTVPQGLEKGGKGNRRGRRARAWCFTDNTIWEDGTHPTTKLQRTVQQGLQALSDDVRYIIFQRERGVEATTDHFQGYVEFHRPYGLSGVKSRVSGTAHWEIRRGPQKRAIAYCTKADTKVDGPWEYGEKASQGTRTDINELTEAVRGGASKRKLIEDYPLGVAKYGRYIDTVKEAFFKSEWRHVECILLIGKTRTGKTRWVYDNWRDEDFYVLPPIIRDLWFDGYMEQTHVLMDDFAGQGCFLTTLLRILGGYTIPLPKKGGFIYWKPTHIAVTTNVHPNRWYPWEGKRSQYDALAARFTKVMSFEDDGECTEYTPLEYFILE